MLSSSVDSAHHARVRGRPALLPLHRTLLPYDTDMESHHSPEALAFAERILRQAASRFPAQNVHLDERRFAISIQAPDRTTTLPLARLYDSCMLHPVTAAAEIARFMRQAEKLLSPAPLHTLPPLHPVWLVLAQPHHAVPAPELVHRALVPPVTAVIGERHGDQYRAIVRKRWLDRNITIDSAAERADAATSDLLRETCISWGTELAARHELLLTFPPPSLHASFLAVQELRLLTARASGTDVLAALPERDTLLLAVDDRKGKSWIQHQGRLMYEESRHPGTARVLRISSASGTISVA